LFAGQNRGNGGQSSSLRYGDRETAEMLNFEPGAQKLKIMFVALVSMIEVHKMSAVQVSKPEPVVDKSQVMSRV